MLDLIGEEEAEVQIDSLPNPYLEVNVWAKTSER